MRKSERRRTSARGRAVPAPAPAAREAAQDAPHDAAREARRREDRLVLLLALPAARGAAEGSGVAVVAAPHGASVRAGRAPREAADALVGAGAAAWEGAGPARALRLTPAGAARARRLLAAPGDAPHLAAQLPLEDAAVTLPDGARGTVRRDAAESPLAWLARRRGPGGAPLLDAAQVMAGERLRADLSRAGSVPSLGARWDAVPGGGGAGLTLTEAMLAARQRVEAALAAVGPELAGPLVDLCGHLTGLEAIERARGLPARSGKAVIGLGLRALARHYGLSASARGPARGRPRAWRAAPSRPDPAAREGEGGG